MTMTQRLIGKKTACVWNSKDGFGPGQNFQVNEFELISLTKQEEIDNTGADPKSQSFVCAHTYHLGG